MKRVRRSLTIFLTLLVCFAFVPAALAHPLGNFTVNQYAGVQISRESITVDFVMEMAEIPAFQEIELLDANGNRQPDLAEVAGYHPVRCASLQSSLNLSLNNQAVTLSLVSSSMEFPAGVGGLLTMRMTCEFQAPIEITSNAVALSFQNKVFADRLGWHEIVVVPDGVTVQGEYSPSSLSDRLTHYPQDLLSSPLEQRELEIQIASAGLTAQGQSPAQTQQSNPSSRRDDAFTRLILLDASQITLPTLLLALAV